MRMVIMVRNNRRVSEGKGKEERRRGREVLAVFAVLTETSIK